AERDLDLLVAGALGQPQDVVERAHRPDLRSTQARTVQGSRTVPRSSSEYAGVSTWWQKDRFANSLVITFSSVDGRRAAALLPHWATCRRAVVRHGIIARRRGHAGAPHLSRFLELDARSFKHWRHFWTAPCGRSS